MTAELATQFAEATNEISLAGLAQETCHTVKCDINNSEVVRQQDQQQLPKAAAELLEHDSGKSSSCSPVQVDCSLDSGIAVAAARSSSSSSSMASFNAQTMQRLQECKRILQLLDRDQDNYRLLRDRLSKIAERKRKRSPVSISDEQMCNVCCAEVDGADPKRSVRCCTCALHVCRNANCASWLASRARWECKLCYNSKESYAHTSSWVADQISFSEQNQRGPLRARSEAHLPTRELRDGRDSAMNFDTISQISANSAFIGTEQKLKIREFVEEVVANLLGGSLDRVKVDKLSKSENYLPGIINGHYNYNNSNNNNDCVNNNNNNNKNSSSDALDAANISQAHLRQLVRSIIAETLSTSKGGSDNEQVANEREAERHSKRERYFQPNSYQDLLATAILNKIADKEGNIRSLAESTPELSSRRIDENFNVEALSTTSGSSIEPRSDWSLTDNEPALNADQTDSHARSQASMDRESVLSDYIATHSVPLPDLTASLTDTDEDFGSVTSSMIGDGTWESNWLFKKKHANLPTSTTSSSGMLVPAPVENVRAQIGDKTTDEVSDLSELGSDSEDCSLDLLRCNELNDRLLNKHLIGGQNTKAVLDELVECTSLISQSPSLTEGDADSVLAETKNTYIKKPFIIEEAVNKNIAEVTAAPPVDFQDSDEAIAEEVVAEDEPSVNPITDQLSSGSNGSGSTDESGPTTCVIINGDIELEPDALTNNTNKCKLTNTKHTMDLTNQSPVDASNGTTKLTNGKLRRSNKFLARKTPRSAKKYDSGDSDGGQAINDDNDDDGDDGYDDGDDGYDDEEKFALKRRFVPGSIAERECMKWYNAVEMPNNPYSPAALQERISGNRERCLDLPNIVTTPDQTALPRIVDQPANVRPTETEYKRYSRDYYINGTLKMSPPPAETNFESSATDQAADADADADNDIIINELPTSTDQVSIAAPIEFGDSPSMASNLSLQSVHTNTSEDSDTVRIYDFNKQETAVIRKPKQLEAAESPRVLAPPRKRERPQSLEYFGSAADGTVSSTRSTTPTRGTTPPAFRFMQPKRKLIEPNQVLSVDEDEKVGAGVLPLAKSNSFPNGKPVQINAAARPVIEQEVAQVMPSVKALAKAFLMTSRSTQSAERHWTSKKSKAVSPQTPKSSNAPMAATRRMTLQPYASLAEVADEATIASDLSSLETDPSMNLDPEIVEATPEEPATATATTPGRSSPVPVRAGFLKSNIAFFENLKFK